MNEKKKIFGVLLVNSHPKVTGAPQGRPIPILAFSSYDKIGINWSPLTKIEPI